MVKKTAKIIHDARVFFFAFILASFLFQVGLNPIDFGKYVGLQIASAAKMNVSAEVKPNQYSKLAVQLETKEDMLNSREQDLLLLQKKIEKQGSITGNVAILGLSGGITILFFLMMLNYYMDYRRKKTILKNSKLLRFFSKKLV